MGMQLYHIFRQHFPARSPGIQRRHSVCLRPYVFWACYLSFFLIFSLSLRAGMQRVTDTQLPNVIFPVGKQAQNSLAQERMAMPHRREDVLVPATVDA